MQEDKKDDIQYEEEEDIQYEVLNPEEVLKRDTLRILDIGNSYSQDGTRYLQTILCNMNLTDRHVCYYNLVRSSGSFSTWYNCLLGKDTQPYNLYKVTGDITQSVKEGTYNAGDSTGISQALSQTWDVIVLHQVSTYANDASLWDTDGTQGRLSKLIRKIKSKQPHALLAFALVHSYASTYDGNTEHSSYERWQNIVKATDDVRASHPEIGLVIPCGTAIETLRASKYCDESELTRDGTHIGFGLACYADACCCYETLLAPHMGISIAKSPFRWKCSKTEQKTSKYTSSCIDVTEDNASAAIQAALQACKDYHNLGVINDSI